MNIEELKEAVSASDLKEKDELVKALEELHRLRLSMERVKVITGRIINTLTIEGSDK